MIDNERRNIYQGIGRHYENMYAISFTFKPKVDLGSKLGQFFKRTEHHETVDYSYYLKVFKEKVSEVVELITTQLNLQKMNVQDILSYISWCITSEKMQLSIPQNY